MTDCTMQYKAVAEQFCIEGEILEVCPYGEGHINLTLLVTTDKKRYIMQKMNTKVFPDPVNLMRNICGVTEHLRDVYAGAFRQNNRITGRHLYAGYLSLSDDFLIKHVYRHIIAQTHARMQDLSLT